MAKSIYNSTELMHPGHSKFHITHRVNTTMDMGFRLPCFFREVLPNEKWNINLSMFLRMQPMVSAPFTPIRAYFHFWFCPTRVLMEKWFSQLPGYQDSWQTFIFGGEDGDGKNRFGTEIQLPLAVPSFSYSSGAPEQFRVALDVQNGDSVSMSVGYTDGLYSLWDYFGFPIDKFHEYIATKKFSGTPQAYADPTIKNFAPLIFPFYMYQFIYDEFYRDENLEDSRLPFASSNSTHSPFCSDSSLLFTIRRCLWHADYFTKSLPFQQRGAPVALPLSGIGKLNWDSVFNTSSPGSTNAFVGLYRPSSGSDSLVSGPFSNNGSVDVVLGNVAATSDLKTVFSSATFDMSQAVSTDVSGLRLMFQIQKWRERAARGGVRLVEGLLAFFGVAPHDDILQRPVFIGGLKQDIIVSEVLQTSATDSQSPQGNIAGRGISAAKSHIGSYFSREHGYIMGLMWIRPDTYYASQGMHREMLRRSKYDFYWPQFAHLSERPVFKAEIYCDPTTMTANQLGLGSEGIFGYQGIYNELRSSTANITAGMRDQFSYWHLAREFSSAPTLNSSFIRCMPRKDIFAVQDEHPFMVDLLVDCSVYRPIPIRPIPGLIDHA